MREKIIILGAGVMQGPVIRIARELGYYAVVLDGSKDAPCISMADRFEHIDLKDKEAIEAFARNLQKEGGIGIMTAGTDFSASVAWVAEKLGLPGIPYEAALNASDKGRMRECFKKAGVPSPDFITITKEDNLENISLSFPLVIKPVDNMGSRGCRRVDNKEELEQAAKAALGFSRCGRAIVETYMDGPEFSVDAIVWHEEITICGLADRHIYFPPYFIEMGHTMPTSIKEEKQKELLDAFCEGVRALGITGKNNAGAAKGDIKLTSKGPMIGEIAARLSGGYMSGWTYPYSSGAEPVRAAILGAMGHKPEGLIPTKAHVCAERAFISIPGTVKSITDDKKAHKHPNVNDHFLLIDEGSKVTFPENNVTKCGNIIASAPSRETAISAAETAAKSILIELEPDDPVTAQFLSQIAPSDSFPPNAFKITEEIRAALEQVDEPVFSSLFHEFSLVPFPAFTSSGLTDYMGRSIDESLEAVHLLISFPPSLRRLLLPVGEKKADNVVLLGRSFWAAFIRGGYQGAVYYIENLGKHDKDKNL
jgi:biotin carboxylase